MEFEHKRIVDFDAKGLLAFEQVKRWEVVYGFKVKNLPGYANAAAASEEHWFNRITVGLDKAYRDFPSTLGLLVRIAFVEGRENLLSFSEQTIIEAARKNDENFFIELGKLLQKRKKLSVRGFSLLDEIGKHDKDAFVELRRFMINRKKPAVPEISFSESCQALVDALWADALLWLMTDNAALEFFENIVGLTFSLAAYKAAYIRSGYDKHPDLPIIDVEAEQMKSGSEPQMRAGTAGKRMKVSWKLRLRDGWAFSENTLMKLSR